MVNESDTHVDESKSCSANQMATIRNRWDKIKVTHCYYDSFAVGSIVGDYPLHETGKW